jgi:tetratricopeptide (TPR) repeat protein
VNDLEKVGFLKRESDGQIVFYHQSIQSYFVDESRGQQISPALLKRFIQEVNALRLRNSLIIPVFIAEYLTDSLEENTFRMAINRILVSGVENDYAEEIFEYFSNLLEDGFGNIDSELYSRIYWKIETATIARKGLEGCLKFNERVFRHFVENPWWFQNSLEDVFKILKEYTTHLLNLKLKNESLEKVSKLIDIVTMNFADESFSNWKEGREQLVGLYCRRVMVYYSLADYESAFLDNNLAMKIAYNNKFIPLIIRCWRSNGDIYQSMPDAGKHRQDIADSWHRAFQIYREEYGFDNNRGKTDHLKISTTTKSLFADIITENWEAAPPKVSFLISCLDKTNMSHYEIQIRMALAFFIIISNRCLEVDSSDYEDAKKFLNQAIDLTAIYGRQASSICAHHAKAILEIEVGQNDLALDDYFQTIKLIKSDLRQESAIRDHFFIETAMIYRGMFHEKVENAFLELGERAKNESEAIEVKEESEFEEFFDNYQTPALFSDSQGKIGFLSP